MQDDRPTRTLADFLVVCVSPILIMLLVGSLCFFLIEVFGRGEAVGSLRWMMFWFVLAIVLVSRIGIEQGAGHAMVYGGGLAAAVWLYLLRLFPELFVWDMVLLAIVWWCANKLVWDCTLVDENEDASGSGLLQPAADKNFFLAPEKGRVKNSAKNKKSAPHPPGLWVVYFSLAALPLFGIGQMLLPRGDIAARHAGFDFLFIYMAAAFGLLLVTSFLGLRRYLRQRYVQMPAAIAFGWVRFGVCVGAFVLMAALLLPRPGAGDAWMTMRHQIDYRLHQASNFAMRFSPHGTGKGRSGNEPSHSNQQNNPANSPSGNQTSSSQSQSGHQSESGKTPRSGNQHSGQSQNPPPQQQPQFSTPPANPFYNWFKILFFVALGLLAAWWVFRQRSLILQAIQSIIASIADFFRNLFAFRFSLKPAGAVTKKNQIRRPFSAFHNPFLTGKEQSWTQTQLILYSYDALRAWAQEHGIEPRPEQTAREFCVEVAGVFPEIHSELNRLSVLYSRTAYGMEQVENQNLEPLKELWRYFYTGAASRDLIPQS
ncbi:MAG TPA: DUF4129 domain-containing protein [Candidatus Sulfotelmatobacter sp.]|nr:DUF4129 domain-containing protein [Candidatus Sulfotelmatobacter sp.]